MRSLPHTICRMQKTAKKGSTLNRENV